MTSKVIEVDANNLIPREVFLNKLDELDEEPEMFYSVWGNAVDWLNKLFGDY